jgi:hypothetical protein
MEKRRSEGLACGSDALDALWAEERKRMERSAMRIGAHGEARAA